MLFVVDTEAARTALHAGKLTCPQTGCGGRLHPWGVARPRTVLTRVGEPTRLRPDRGRCGRCRAGQTLLPAWYVPRRSCGIGVIGAAIAAHLESGHGHARIAAGLGVATATVRGWLGGLKGAAAAVYDLARQACRGGVGYVWRPERPLRSTFDQSVPEVLRAMDELALVALAFTRPDPPHRVGGVTGIDYIHLLGQQQRRDHNRLLRLVDPTDDRPALGLWPAINVISGGRLLAVITARIVPAAPG